ncbi:hypothetical protein [Rhodococcus sp. NPDC060176]|uniref:hypothetical protein n=1 Tax=Rhodococcus sp. NPDC060176 TaxID=3347062 RepID=UPI003660BEB0
MTAELDALAAHFDTAALGLVNFKGDGPRDPEAFDLRMYWTLGKGGAKVAWGYAGDHQRCTIALGKHVGEDRAKRICASYHKDLFGVAPRESVVAAKPPLPDGWDFDADSPEDAMPPEPTEDDEDEDDDER